MQSHMHTFEEVRLSDCPAGCKVGRCDCGAEAVEHRAIYGCSDGDSLAIEWEPMQGPSIAALHRRWLDQGMPSHTWGTLLKSLVTTR
jgi:hypothetical protein